MARSFRQWVFVLVSILLPVTAAAAVSSVTTEPGSAAALCQDAARMAAARYGIPDDMMQAITLVETRRKVGGVSGPWPWTLNVEGKGYWYDARGEALGHAKREIASGRLSVDLGCFQLNYRWHGANFSELGDMLDPVLAADYAARFLRDLHAETGDWMRAAGHYHSRTQAHAQRYRGMIGRALASLDGGQDGAKIAANSQSAPAVAVAPGPRPARRQPVGFSPGDPAGFELAGVKPVGSKSGEAKPLHETIVTAARFDSNPAATPGAVVLRMFARSARPLLAANRTIP